MCIAASLAPNAGGTGSIPSQGTKMPYPDWCRKKKMCMKSGSVKVLVAQLCPTLRDPIDCSLPGSTVHGMFQAATLKWVAISFSRHLLDPGIEPGSPALHTLFIV